MVETCLLLAHNKVTYTKQDGKDSVRNVKGVKRKVKIGKGIPVTGSEGP
jgi:hypothetical protein